MPELDFMVLCDYVRAEKSGVLHMIAAGIDTIHASVVPHTVNLAIGLRLRLSYAEIEYEHRLQLVLQDADGKRITDVNGSFRAPRPSARAPQHWGVGMGLALNAVLPLPNYGEYSFELLINGNRMKSIPLRVVPAERRTPG